MARVFTQTGGPKLTFLEQIADKQASREQTIRERVETATPTFLHWALKPLATGMVRTKHRQDHHKGVQGEFAVSLRLWARLPNTWTVINDVVLEFAQREYAQLDHIVIGPSCIFLIETKAWHGAVLLKNDQCFRKEAGRWIKTSSPISQNRTHLRRFRQWYTVFGLPQPMPPIEPIVVFTRTTWLRADRCSMPVMTPQQTPAYLLKQGTGQQLNAELIDALVEKILTVDTFPATTDPDRLNHPATRQKPHVPSVGTTQPLPHVQQGISRNGKKYVRVRGKREVAQKVWEEYGCPGTLSIDRIDKDVFFFYYE